LWISEPNPKELLHIDPMLLGTGLSPLLSALRIASSASAMAPFNLSPYSQRLVEQNFCFKFVPVLDPSAGRDLGLPSLNIFLHSWLAYYVALILVKKSSPHIYNRSAGMALIFFCPMALQAGKVISVSRCKYVST
jgi:hypothetical protein